MKILIFIIIFAIVCALSVTVRTVVSNPIKVLKNVPVDVFNYFRYKKWRNMMTGFIICFVALFGKGKTLSAVHFCVSMYNRYNDKKVYDPHRKKWVTQKVHIISNVDLAIPFERFVSLAQIVSLGDRYKKIDEENDTLTVHLVLGDEFSVQLNSRSFKSNIDPLFLNTLLTCRHHHIALVYTAQRFNHVDALLRQVTQTVYTCDKIWRVLVHKKYDAFELENASNPTDVRSLGRFGWFIQDKDYEAYDTLACVQNLSKSCSEGDMLSESEILALQQNTPTDMDAVSKPSRKYVKRMKKVRK